MGVKIQPLTEAVYYILLSVKQPLHGYGIMQNVSKLTNGRLNLGAGTLYGAISNLLSKGLISEYSNNNSKKEYIITESGTTALNNELERLEELVNNGKQILGGKQ
ncbi:MAG: PadR family transcriptional regulator [Ruminococcus sp.]|nr:PadR family transcriptional regulator [Ruminococcus sp.]